LSSEFKSPREVTMIQAERIQRVINVLLAEGLVNASRENGRLIYSSSDPQEVG